MPRTVTAEEFGRNAQHLLESVRESGDSVIVREGEESVAILATHDSVLAMSTMLDLPRWESWLNEMRESFPEAAERLEGLRTKTAEARALDKDMLGFDPAAGVFGSAAGREFFASELRRLAIPLSEGEVFEATYAAALELCEEKQSIYPEDLRALAQEKISESAQRVRLLALSIQSALGLPATAEVTLQIEGDPAMRQERGDGPLDAAFKAIERLTGMPAEVENFSVVSATKGRDATAEAMIQLNVGGDVAVGAGACTNAVEAGVHAYLNALNLILEARAEKVAGAAPGGSV